MFENLIPKRGNKEPKVEAYEARMTRLQSQVEVATDSQLQEWQNDDSGFSDLAHAATGELIRRGVEQPKYDPWQEN